MACCRSNRTHATVYSPNAGLENEKNETSTDEITCESRAEWIMRNWERVSLEIPKGKMCQRIKHAI